MESDKDTLYASPAQWKVIQWLFNYPTIYITWADMLGTFISWSALWANEEARQHMIKVMGDIGSYFGVPNVEKTTKPRIKPLDNGTPRCCFQTFKSLLKENIICKYTNGCYQLSLGVRKQLEIDELDSLVRIISPSKRREDG